ncbi:FUSC family protein [Leucobacter soli]|uniref:FUSC family protein n=1 Tax=Leucobacter soli TaxID=2812850 RepID=UPI00361DA645
MTDAPTRIWRRVERRLTGRFTVAMRPPILQLMKAAGSAILTWFACLLLFPGELPIFGAIAALIVVQDNVDQSLTRGIERVVGVLIGVSVALGAAHSSGLRPGSSSPRSSWRWRSAGCSGCHRPRPIRSPSARS